MPAAGSLEALPGWAVELLETVRVGHLGLLDDDGHPRVLPVTFARFEGALWSAVDDKPKRVAGERLARLRWLRARPASSLTIDRYDDDWTRLAWVQVIGLTTVHEVADHGEALAALAARYPQYREQPPRGPLLRLAPERVVHWRATDPA
jgi:PPOX class probable F420-dependent enzyme